jgi:hypothetical protein
MITLAPTLNAELGTIDNDIDHSRTKQILAVLERSRGVIKSGKVVVSLWGNNSQGDTAMATSCEAD